jgi:hypothetical protein
VVDASFTLPTFHVSTQERTLLFAEVIVRQGTVLIQVPGGVVQFGLAEMIRKMINLSFCTFMYLHEDVDVALRTWDMFIVLRDYGLFGRCRGSTPDRQAA